MADYEIIPRAAWGAKPPTAPLSPMTQPDGWVVHYVGGPMQQDPTYAQSVSAVYNLQQGAFNGDNGEKYIDIPYNFLVDLNGRIFEGRGWDYKSGANGSSNYNGHAWAVCVLMGPGDGQPSDKNRLTQEAKDALSWLTREGAKRRPAVSYVKGHRDVYATHCPGDECYAYVSELNSNLHVVEVVPPIDWHALEGIAKFLNGLPVRLGDRGPVVASLNDLLILHGAPKTLKGEAYGYRTRVWVNHLKVAWGWQNTDGKAVGKPFGHELVTHK